MPTVRAHRMPPRFRPILALALAALAVAPSGRADEIFLSVFSSADFEPGRVSDRDQGIGVGASKALASTYSSAGPVEASAEAVAEIVRGLDQRSGKVIFGAAGLIRPSLSPSTGFRAAESGTNPSGILVNIAITEPTVFRLIYAASGTRGPGVFRFPGHEEFFGNGSGGFSINFPSAPVAPQELSIGPPRVGGGYHGFSSPPLNWAGGLTVIWGLGTLPGETPDAPLGPDSIPPWVSRPSLEPSEREAAGSDIPASATGTFCSVPVTQGYGMDNFVFIDPEIAAGYLYTVEGSSFAQFLLPEPLAGGDSSFRLYFNGGFHDYTAGQAFDFTAFDPDGVSRFLLLGIDASEGIDPGASHAPFVSGLKFTTAGLARVWQVPLAVTAVPEPSSAAMLGLGALGFGWRLRKAKATWVSHGAVPFACSVQGQDSRA